MSKPSTKPDIERRAPKGYEEHDGDRQFATTLSRGLELLRCFTAERPVLSNKELAERMALPPSTISRLAYTLVCMGYLRNSETYGKYELGSAVLSLGNPLLAQFGIRTKARKLMLEVAQDLGGSVSIGIRDRFSIVYIEAIFAIRNQVHFLDVGTAHSLAGTAIGRAYFMALRPAEREALLNQLRVKAPDEWTRHGQNLLDNIAQYARWGCCVSVGEIYPDIQAVAVPLGRIDNGEAAALNCAFQGPKLDVNWLRKSVAPRLKSIAHQLA